MRLAAQEGQFLCQCVSQSDRHLYSSKSSVFCSATTRMMAMKFNTSTTGEKKDWRSIRNVLNKITIICMKNKQTKFFIIGFINEVSRAANVVVGLLLSAL